MRLNWSGVAGSRADVFRNATRVATTANDGSYTDKLPKRAKGTFSYKVCAAGTQTCSQTVSVGIGGLAQYAGHAVSPWTPAMRFHERQAPRFHARRR